MKMCFNFFVLATAGRNFGACGTTVGLAVETPVPVRFTCCGPDPSSLVICQAPDAGPALLGVNVTDSVSV
jgi:hypothetical protein